MNKIFSTQDGLCVAFTDDDFEQKMLVLKYNKELGKLGVGLLNEDTVLGKFTLDPKTTCKVLADYFTSVGIYDKHMHPAEEEDDKEKE